MPGKQVCGTPQELLKKVLEWKTKELHKEDKDHVWCIFDIDDFYNNSKHDLLEAVKNAEKNGIKIAYANECFELWILLHFKNLNSSVQRGKNIEREIREAFKINKLGSFTKNQKVFQILLPFQSKAIKNAKKLLPCNYNDIDWDKMLSVKGNPSTNIHLLVEEINDLYKD